MDYINNKGENIGSLTNAVSNDRSITIQPNPRCHDCEHSRPASQARFRRRPSSVVRRMENEGLLPMSANLSSKVCNGSRPGPIPGRRSPNPYRVGPRTSDFSIA